ncbi:MAG: ABC transporter permease [Methanomassiliicoccus sp.]|nr:ABC transporter permease [Methanomassiliicoccus sp.]
MSRIASQLLASILVNAIYEMRNYPVILINTLISPLSFLILVVFVTRGELLGFAIVGGMIMTMFQSGMSLQADLSHLKNDFKLQEMVVASPTGPGVYVAGMALSELIYSSPAIFILAVLFALYVPVTALGAVGIAVVLLLMFLTSVSLGFALATVSSDIVQSFAFSRLITTLFSTLAPVYYPLNLIPPPFQYLAYLSPTTYTARLAHSLAGLEQVSPETMMLDWLVVISLTAIFLWIGIRKSRWRER